MSDKSSSSAGGGLSFASALGLLFIGLKLGHVIDWPWIWVLAPFWIGLVLVVLILLIGLLIAFIAALFGR